MTGRTDGTNDGGGDVTPALVVKSPRAHAGASRGYGSVEAELTICALDWTRATPASMRMHASMAYREVGDLLGQPREKVLGYAVERKFGQGHREHTAAHVLLLTCKLLDWTFLTPYWVDWMTDLMGAPGAADLIHKHWVREAPGGGLYQQAVVDMQNTHWSNSMALLLFASCVARIIGLSPDVLQRIEGKVRYSRD